jgi:hypothetical protein
VLAISCLWRVIRSEFCLLDSLQDHLGLGTPRSYLQEAVLSAQWVLRIFALGRVDLLPHFVGRVAPRTCDPRVAW